MQITHDLNDQLMVMAAHRYCLGRSSYIVGSCIEWLTEHWDQIRDNTQNVIIRDTIDAIDQEQAGMELDLQSWHDFVTSRIKMLNKVDRDWLLHAILYRANDKWRELITEEIRVSVKEERGNEGKNDSSKRKERPVPGE